MSVCFSVSGDDAVVGLSQTGLLVSLSCTVIGYVTETTPLTDGEREEDGWQLV